MTWPTDDFPTADEIYERLETFGNDVRFKGKTCTVHDLEKTVENRKTNFVRIGRLDAGSPNRKGVLITAGVHAREWAPPTAVTNLIGILLEANDGPGKLISIGGATWSVDDVHQIFDGVDLYVAPMINPDGYQFSREHNRMWRKNRKPAPSVLPPGCLAANAVGVDINRNFDVLWDFDKFYVSPDVVGASKNPCDFEVFTGFVPGVVEHAFSEPESRNVRSLLEKDPEFFVDVHMHGGHIEFSWGVEENDPISGPTPVLNPGRVRDGHVSPGNPNFNGYKEPINKDFLQEIGHLANHMGDATLEATGVRYDAVQSGLVSVISGASDDYAFSRNLGTAKPPIKAFTLECGTSFVPTFDTEFPNIQREVQAALLALLRTAAKRPLSSGPKSCWRCSC